MLKTGFCPKDHIYVRINNTFDYETLFNNPKIDSTIEYKHACMWVHEREDEPEMADVLEDLAVQQKLAQQDLDDTNMIQSNQVFTNPSKEEVTNPKYTP